jgi:hypothetical protein
MHRRAVTEIEEHASLLGQRLRRDAIGDRFGSSPRRKQRAPRILVS